ncbi:MAG: hypothetical protein ACRDIV_13105 [Ktedonobacteraceae bacterium]
MHFPSRLKVSISLLALFALAGSFMLYGLLSRGNATHAAHAASVKSFGATTGTLTPFAVVDPKSQTMTADATAAGSTHPRSARRYQSSTNAPTHAPQVSSSSQVSPTGTLLEGFNGVSSRDSGLTNFGAEFEPPDQGLCVGNGFVVEPVNSAFTIYRNDGKIVAGPFNVNKLFAEGPKQFTSDPRCYFDKTTNTWFATILFINSTNTAARTDIAVNNSGDPTTPWTVYHLDATDNNHPGCPCFGDQPTLGIDAFNLYITTNEFSITGTAFNGAQIYAVSKPDLVSLSKQIHFVHFDNLSIGGSIAASVQPALTNGAPQAEFFLNSLDPNGTGDNRIGVWAITNRTAVWKGGVPTLSNVVLTSEAYSIPPGAQQKGATSLLDSGDDRMQQTQFIGGNVWGELDTAVSITGDTATRAGAAWFKVSPSLDNTGVLTASTSIANQGYVASKGNYLLYPALQASKTGSAGMVLTLSGANHFPSAVYVVMRQGQSAFGKINIAGFGTTFYSPTSTRWGDYSWAVLSPDGQSFWFATEYVPPRSSQTVDQLQDWGTFVIQVSV